MRKVRIEPGNPLAAFTGKLSGVPFENGVSLREVTPKEARRIGINITIVDAETGEQAGLRPNVGDIPAAPLAKPDVTPDPVEDKVETVEEVLETEPVHVYTREELEKIAEDDGIRGIREIARKYDVKGVQISQLIAGILQTQGK